jgi:hypothetical protein
MLLLIAVLACIAAAFLLVRYTNRQSLPSSETNRYKPIEPENLRPLFAPTDADLRAREQEQAEREAAKERALADAEKVEQEARLRRLISAWRTSPDRQNTIDLLVRATETSEAEIMAEVAEEIIRVFNKQGIGGLSPGELAALLDSHCRLLPQTERGSGALFWVKEEIAALRSRSIA